MDAAGAAYADERVLADLHAKTNAPLFGAQSVYLGAGYCRRIPAVHRRSTAETADVAIRLLAGASPQSIKLPLQGAGRPTFDWRELERWGIPESRLPPGSVVHYRVLACGAHTGSRR